MPRDDKSETSGRDASAIVGYEDFLSELKSRISSAQLRAVVAVNKEWALINHIRNFLIELGVGFAFVGSQYHLEVGGEHFYIDLLFYHLRLRCYIVIDLKIEEFKPEFSGKMNFYVSAVDDLLRHPDD